MLLLRRVNSSTLLFPSPVLTHRWHRPHTHPHNSNNPQALTLALQ